MGRTRHQRKAFERLCRKLGLSNIIKAVDAPAPFRSWLANIILRYVPRESPAMILPLKHIRLQQLADESFNVPVFHYWLRGELKNRISELEDFWKKHGRISLRNVTEEKILDQTPKLPVKYDQSDWDSISDFCLRHNEQYHTLVNEALPLRDSLMAGNIILLDSERYVVSYFEGYGTPRDVDDKPSSELKIYLCSSRDQAPGWAPRQLEELVPRLQMFRTDFRPITFEFSRYPYPVGLLQGQEVFWEWRSGSAHDLYTVVARMLERADSHELIFQLPAEDPIPEFSGRSFPV